MYLLGYDIGSSSVKACLVDESGQTCASAFYPKQEMPIKAVRPGWAEQDPADWWTNLKAATAEALRVSGVSKKSIGAIGISYQMHGLVCVDRDMQVLRPSIIWCDSRAVPYGEKAFRAIGENECLSHLLNSPGNFTAAKLSWVKENEPDIFAGIYKIMLPGDYIAARLTGSICTTASGLSEGIFWDFSEGKVSDRILDYFGFSQNVIPDIVPTFSRQGTVTEAVADELGLAAGTPVCYRAGDQPNNALSLNVLQPGEIAATAGTSGVVYGVNEQIKYDPLSRVNTFVHVNYTPQVPRTGVLLCINGTGILNSWAKKNIAREGISYSVMNDLAAEAPVGADGLSILPFGNGAERMLGNREPGCIFDGLNFNIHHERHLLRAVQEGIVYSFKYGIEVMQSIGIDPKTIRAGNANMFLSPLFREALATITGASIELFDTDGAVGAAKGAGVGAGVYKTPAEALSSLKRIETIAPNPSEKEAYEKAYQRWKDVLNKNLNN
ncbi:MAG: carbohydrate kinase [Bacteroidales bacterium]|jgi:xylulokinase|nr:carbohydrate kinase [Bacteroidales bacterium]